MVGLGIHPGLVPYLHLVNFHSPYIHRDEPSHIYASQNDHLSPIHARCMRVSISRGLAKQINLAPDHCLTSENLHVIQEWDVGLVISASMDD